MLYPILTVSVGAIMVWLSVVAIMRLARDGGLIINPIRFLVSGLLLIAHFPLTHLLEKPLAEFFDRTVELETNDSAAYWCAVFILVTVQLVVLPTARELYASYFLERISRRGSTV